MNMYPSITRTLTVIAFAASYAYAVFGGTWRRWIDTSLAAPEDVVDWEKAPAVTASSYLVQPRSLALLIEQEIQ